MDSRRWKYYEMKKLRQPTPYKFYWGGSANLKSIATIQVLCTLIVKRSVAPQQNLYATLALIIK